MKRLFLVLSILLCSSSIAFADVPPYQNSGSFSNNGFGTSPIACDKSAIINVNNGVNAQLVAASGSTVIYVCSFSMTIAAATTANVSFKYGTGTTCGTGTTQLTGLFGSAVAAATPFSVSQGSGLGVLFAAPAGNALCVFNGGSGAGSAQGVLTYAQF